ncbi:MAG: hypothetical protein N2505_00155 [Endomicrobia bacterium]|nr:hypothetical protein [Endomicrobiia bacterium]
MNHYKKLISLGLKKKYASIICKNINQENIHLLEQKTEDEIQKINKKLDNVNCKTKILPIFYALMYNIDITGLEKYNASSLLLIVELLKRKIITKEDIKEDYKFNIKNLDENIIRVLDKLQNKNHNLPINEDSITRLSYILDKEYFDLVLTSGEKYIYAITFYEKFLEIGLSLDDLQEMKLNYLDYDEITMIHHSAQVTAKVGIDKIKKIKFDIFNQQEIRFFFWNINKNNIDNVIKFYPNKILMFFAMFTNDEKILNILQKNSKLISNIIKNFQKKQFKDYDLKEKIQWIIYLLKKNVNLKYISYDLPWFSRRTIEKILEENNDIDPNMLFNHKFLQFLQLAQVVYSMFFKRLIEDLKQNINVLPIIFDIKDTNYNKEKYEKIRYDVLNKKLTKESIELFLKYFEDVTNKTTQEKKTFQYILNFCNDKIKSKLFFEYFNLNLQKEKFSIFQAFLSAKIKFLPRKGLRFNEIKICISI